MVKIHDGSLVPASELISGTVEDDEGNPLKFKQVKDATVPTYQAISKVDERTVRVFQFGFDDTPIRVSMLVKEKEGGGEGAGEGKGEEKESPSTEKAVKEVSPATDTKKNSIGSSSSSNPTGTTFGRK